MSLLTDTLATLALVLVPAALLVLALLWGARSQAQPPAPGRRRPAPSGDSVDGPAESPFEGAYRDWATYQLFTAQRERLAAEAAARQAADQGLRDHHGW